MKNILNLLNKRMKKQINYFLKSVSQIYKKKQNFKSQLLPKENEISKLLPYKSVFKTKEKSLTFAKSEEVDKLKFFSELKDGIDQNVMISMGKIRNYNDQLSENIKWKIVPKRMKMDSCIISSSFH